MYSFKDPYLSNIWRLHPSYKKSVAFQRLEFFGDKILSFVLTSYLMKNKTLNEGDLSIQLSMLINKNTLAQVGQQLSKHIICTGELTNAMICDCVEAYITCVYLDGGDVFEMIHNMWNKFLYQIYEPSYKNQLQEFLQARKLNIDYIYEQSINNSCFTCTAILIENKSFFSIGKGVSKKEASSEAAKIFLKTWKTEISKKYKNKII